jgi:DNA-binding MarR family transcriptional regulator
VNGPAAWRHWASKQRGTWGLTDGQAAVLNELASHANGDGETYISVHALAPLVGRRPRTVRKVLRDLQAMGLVSTERRGNGQSARRRLHDVLPVEQPRLEGFDQTGRPADRQTGNQTGRPATADVPQIGIPGDTQKEKEGFKEEAAAREQTPIGVLAPTLPRVLEILETAPGLIVVDAAVDAILRAFPESSGYEHERAALSITAGAHERRWNVPFASRQLEYALIAQQSAPRRHASASASAGRSGRRPAAEQEPAEKPWWDGALARAMQRERGDAEEVAS